MGRIKRSLGIILPSIIVLLAMEVGLRVFHTVVSDVADHRREASEWWRYDPHLGWSARPGFSGDVFGAARSFDERGYLSVDGRQIRQSSKPRILLIGDSCTFGHGVAIDDTFGELLERRLAKYDVVNLALPGYTSLQGRIVLQRRIDEIRPEIVVVSFGFNDRRYILKEASIDSEKYFKQVYRGGYLIPQVSYFSYLVRYLYRIARGGDPIDRTLAAPKDEKFYVNSVFPRVSPDAYRGNLDEIIDIAERSGARVLLLSLADSPKRARELYQGIELIDQGKYAEAVQALGPVAYGTSVFSALAKRFLCDLLEKRGRYADAQKVALIEEPIVSLHGGEPLFLDVEYAGIMQQVASVRGVTFVDGTTPLKSHPEYFMDFSHFNEDGHRLIANLLATELGPR